MNGETLLEALQRLDFTQELEPRHQAQLVSMAHRARFSAGHIIFREGDPGELVYLVEDGQVAIDIRVPGKGKTTILTIGPGQLLGWSSLFPGEHKTASARAVTPTEAIAFNAAELREVMQTDHDLGCVLLWRVANVIASRLKATRLQLLDIFAPEQGR